MAPRCRESGWCPSSARRLGSAPQEWVVADEFRALVLFLGERKAKQRARKGWEESAIELAEEWCLPPSRAKSRLMEDTSELAFHWHSVRALVVDSETRRIAGGVRDSQFPREEIGAKRS